MFLKTNRCYSSINSVEIYYYIKDESSFSLPSQLIDVILLFLSGKGFPYTKKGESVVQL